MEQHRPLVAPTSAGQRVNRTVTLKVSGDPPRKKMSTSSPAERRTVDSFASPESLVGIGRQDGATILKTQAGDRGQLTSGESGRPDECSGIARDNYIYLDWKSGSISPSRLISRLT